MSRQNNSQPFLQRILQTPALESVVFGYQVLPEDNYPNPSSTTARHDSLSAWPRLATTASSPLRTSTTADQISEHNFESPPPSNGSHNTSLSARYDDIFHSPSIVHISSEYDPHVDSISPEEEKRNRQAQEQHTSRGEIRGTRLDFSLQQGSFAPYTQQNQLHSSSNPSTWLPQSPFTSIHTRPETPPADFRNTSTFGSPRSSQLESHSTRHRRVVSSDMSELRSSKRQRVSAGGAHLDRPSSSLQKERTIEEIDLVEDDCMADTLQRQRQEQIETQNGAASGVAGKSKLATMQCTICLDSPTDLTVTKCGHLFCRSCLLDWMASAERDAARKANCPSCRKGLRLNLKNDIIPLEILKRNATTGSTRQR